MAVEPQSRSGALAGAAAGPARCAVETPYAAAAALSNAPGIGAGNRPVAPCGPRRESHRCNRLREPNDPAAWGNAARSPMTGKIWRTTPALATRYVRRKTPFQHANCSAGLGLNLFHSAPDKILPGTLHHSGNTPAPPSDHIPLARRSAFQQGRKRGRRRNSAAPAGLKYLARRFCRAYARRSVFSMESWNFAVPLPFLRRSAGDSMNHKGVEHTLTRSQTPGVLAVAISDRRPGQVGIDRGTACAVGHAPRRAENRSRTEARSAPTDVLIGVRLMGVRAGTPGLSLLGRCPDTDQIL